MRSFATFVPFLIYSFFQIAMLVALVYFAYPPISAVLVPLMQWIFGDAAIHYPNNYIVLVPLFDWGNILLSGFVGAITIGVATYLFAMVGKGRRPQLSESVRHTWRRYALLLAVWMVETALVLGAVAGAPTLAAKLLQPGYVGSRLLQYFGLFLAVVVGALFAYTSASIVLSRKGLFRSIQESVRIFARSPIATLLLIAIPTAMHGPVDYLGRKAPILISKLYPESMIVVALLSIAVSFFANYILVGSVTHYFLEVRR